MNVIQFISKYWADISLIFIGVVSIIYISVRKQYLIHVKHFKPSHLVGIMLMAILNIYIGISIILRNMNTLNP